MNDDRKERSQSKLPDPARALHRKFALRGWLSYYVDTEFVPRNGDLAASLQRTLDRELCAFACTPEESIAARVLALRLNHRERVRLLEALETESENV